VENDEMTAHNWICENCTTECPGVLERLPIGWRQHLLTEDVGAINNDGGLVICSFCVARVEKALEESKICGSK
jgi:hypothetical protein